MSNSRVEQICKNLISIDYMLSHEEFNILNKAYQHTIPNGDGTLRADVSKLSANQIENLMNMHNKYFA